MSDATSTSNPSVVAVIGARSFLGTEILSQLVDDPSIDKLVAIDIAEPDVVSDKLVFHRLDLSSPSAGSDLSEVFRVEQPGSVVHGAFLSTPTHDSAWAHEFEDVGTMHVLDVCAKYPPAFFLLLSTTMVYGAKPSNPNYLNEDAKLGGVTNSRYVNDKIRAEEQVLRFARNHENIKVCSLRFAPILGPTITNMYTRVLSRPLTPTVAGYDPLMQILHEADAIRACMLAIKHSAVGAYNIVGKDVLPYTTLLALLGRVPVPMPRPLAKLVAKAMWATRTSPVPDSMLAQLQYLCVADGSKAATRLGFYPKYDIRQTLADFLGVNQDHDQESVTPFRYSTRVN